MKMRKEEADKLAEEVMSFDMSLPPEITESFRMKAEMRLQEEIRVVSRGRKIFWSGAAAVLLINAFVVWFFMKTDKADHNTAEQNDTHVVKLNDYYYSDHSFDYTE